MEMEHDAGEQITGGRKDPRPASNIPLMLSINDQAADITPKAGNNILLYTLIKVSSANSAETIILSILFTFLS